MLLFHHFCLTFFFVSLLLLGNPPLVQSQEPATISEMQSRDSGLPEDFDVEEIRVRLDSPDRFGMRYTSGLLAPTLTAEDGPVWVSGKVRLTGFWRELPGKHKDTFSKKELDFLKLRFRAIRLIGLMEAFQAIERQEFELFEIEEDPDNGERKMVWRVDPTEAKNDEEKEAAQEAGKKRTRWREKKPDQEYELQIPVELPRKKEQVELELPFGFAWYPDGRWEPDVFYAIDVACPKQVQTVRLSRTALFHAARPAREPERELRVAVYTALTSFGIPLDPFWSLK